MNYVIADDKLKSVIKKFILETYPYVYDVKFDSYGVKLASTPGTPSITETVIMPIINNSENNIGGVEIKSLSKEIVNTVDGMFGLKINDYGSGWKIVCVQLAIVGIDTTIKKMR